MVLAIVGVVLGLMALPSVCQMIWGTPQIRLNFNTANKHGAKYLLCELFNLPVRSKILRAFGVTRSPAEQVIASFSIREDGTNRVVLDGTIPEIKTDAGVVSQRARLPGSIIPASFQVVTALESETGIKVGLMAEDTEYNLSPGFYRVDVKVLAAEKRITGNRRFRVGNRFDEVYWL